MQTTFSSAYHWSFGARRLADIVNNIQLNERDFAEYHKSVIAQRFVYDKDTAKLFARSRIPKRKESKRLLLLRSLCRQ